MISPETIALVRDRTDILAVITESVPSLKRRGRSWVGLCPFHKEKTPSFHVNPDRGFFHCFGCKESGSAIDFLMRNEGYTFPEAVRALAERAGIAVEESDKAGTFTEQDRQRKAKDDLYAVNALAATYWEEQLRKHEHCRYAIEELEKRGISPKPGEDRDAPKWKKCADALQAFRIGYAPSGWDGLATFLKQQGVSPVAAETVGLLVPRSGGSGYYDRFRHRLMFAVTDPQGRVVAFSGRALRPLPNDTQAASDPPPKYINSPESPIYTKGNMLFGIHQARHAIRQQEVGVLVEGNFDVVSLHAHGIENVVAPLGTAFTPEQAKLLKRFAESVVFLFDGDDAGRKAVRLSKEAVRSAGLSARVADLPDGVDPDQLAREKGPRAVEDLIAGAKGMLEALVDMALDESFSQADVQEKLSRIDYVVKLIAEEDDPLVRMTLKSRSDQLAGRLDFAEPEAFRALEHRVKQAYAKADAERRRKAEEARIAEEARRAQEARDKPRVVAAAAASPSVNGRVAARAPGQLERQRIFELLIEWPVLLDDPEVAAELGHLEGPSVMYVAALRRAWNPSNNSLDTGAFLEALPPLARGFAARRLAGPETSSVEEAKGYLLETANKLKRLLLSQEAAQITRETYRAQGDWDAERELLREAEDRLRAKHGIKPVAAKHDTKPVARDDEEENE